MIRELTSLRFILILVIFFHHILASYPGGGDMGVAYFLVLSGFCYALGYGDRVQKADFNYRSFIRSRLVKFYPMHWITLLIAVPVSLDVGLGWKNGLIMGINGLLLQSWFPLSSVYYSFNGVSWFLSDLLFLVAVFPFVFRWLRSATGRRIFIPLAAAAYCVLCILTPENQRNTVLYVNPVVRLADFTVGLLSGMWYLKLNDCVAVKDYIRRHGMMLRTMALLAFLVLLAMSIFIPSRYTLMAFIFWPAIVLMLICISLNPGGVLSTPMLYKLGTISFPFYMIHQLVIRYTSLVFLKAGMEPSLFLTIPISLIFSIAVSFLIESALRRFKRNGELLNLQH